MDTAQPPNLTQAARPMDGDAGLVQQVLSGDQTAFTQLVNKYRKQVYAIAYRFSNNAQEADDLAQEAFIKAYQNLTKFRGEASFRTWLLRITTNLSINLVKSGRMSKDSGEAPDEGGLRNSDSQLSKLLDGEKKLALRKAISKLPPKQKATLLLKTYNEMTCEEVATTMNCSVGTVKANVFNALKRLKTLLHAGE